MLNKYSDDEEILNYLCEDNFKLFIPKDMDNWYNKNNGCPTFNYVYKSDLSNLNIYNFYIYYYLLIIELDNSKTHILINICANENNFIGLNLLELNIFSTFKYKNNLIKSIHDGFCYYLESLNQLAELIRYLYKISELKIFE